MPSDHHYKYRQALVEDVVKYAKPPPVLADVRRNNVYANTSVVRKSIIKKENIYENVMPVGNNGSSVRSYIPANVKQLFTKQSSLDAIPIGMREEVGLVYANSVDRKENMRKNDSFEGHEIALRNLVAQVHKNRFLINFKFILSCFLDI